MSVAAKLEKAIVFALRNVISPWSPRRCTQFMLWWYRRQGMQINGTPNYIAASVRFDGTDFSKIELNEGCTISGNVNVLTHDWSPYTIARGLGMEMEKPMGVFRSVRIGAFSFIGVRSMLMPGCDIGAGALIGAGSVVRGRVAPWTIMVGNPAEPVGDSRDFLKRYLERCGQTDLLEQFEKRLKETPPAHGVQAR